MNLPNLLSLLRLLATPVMLWFAWHGQHEAFLWLMLAAWLSDALDGWLARRLNQRTALGARLDSWGDLAFYTALSLGAWWLWPERLRAEGVAIVAIITSYLLPAVIGFIKFRQLPSYHTRAVKVAAVVTAMGVIGLLFFDLGWPLRLAALVCAYAALEEVAITLRLRTLRSNIRSYWQV
ncbi:MAG: CDP-alcohol phosphatidyltransferase family protein [Pseudomonadota bacterium]